MPGTASSHRWLDPKVLAGLGTLELKARVVVEGYLQGLHRSPFRGLSVDFAEYRPYMPGDDGVPDIVLPDRVSQPGMPDTATIGRE